MKADYAIASWIAGYVKHGNDCMLASLTNTAVPSSYM